MTTSITPAGFEHLTRKAQFWLPGRDFNATYASRALHTGTILAGSALCLDTDLVEDHIAAVAAGTELGNLRPSGTMKPGTCVAADFSTQGKYGNVNKPATAILPFFVGILAHDVTPEMYLNGCAVTVITHGVCDVLVNGNSVNIARNNLLVPANGSFALVKHVPATAIAASASATLSTSGGNTYSDATTIAAIDGVADEIESNVDTAVDASLVAEELKQRTGVFALDAATTDGALIPAIVNSQFNTDLI